MNIHRYYFPGQIVFITQRVNGSKSIFSNPEMVILLQEKIINVQQLHPFIMLAYVFLPDHFHILIRPTGDSSFSQTMHSLKTNFTRTYKSQVNINGSLKFWQKRFWDHVIRDETVLENHIHYIHYNPLKHKYVQSLHAWPFSSFEVWRERGLYDGQKNWVEPKNGTWGE